MDLKVNYFQRNRCYSVHFRLIRVCFSEITLIGLSKVHFS
ncbi:hypothetical protein AQPE_0696 [Aquipluma nitroreducens]|uniref:Uncharacterized protein n=1 Tax=Aquipluma nitroreducens TaxID=2010828 RepID=A0A5K7S4V3_9BACT|nr:hypothetical protein AQPE_0696 [Aquipluma nitroreducens]